MAVRFDAAGDRLLRTTDLLNFNAAYTWMGWFFVSVDRNDYSDLMSLNISGAFATSDYCQLGMNGTTLEIGVNGSDSAGTNLSTGTWYHIAIVRASSTSLTCYLNGAVDITNTTNIGARSSVNRMEHGGVGTGNADPFNGRVVASKAWSTNLSAAEVAREMRTYRPQRTDSLYAFWPMRPGATERTRDYSGRGRNWTEGGTLSDEADPPLAWGGRVYIIGSAPAGGGAIEPTSIDDGNLVGSPSLAGAIAPVSIDDGNLVGSPALAGAIAPTSIDDGNLVGSPTLAGAIAPTSIDDGNLVGDPSLAGSIVTVSIDDGGLVGDPVVSAAAGTISPTSIDDGGIVGDPLLSGTISPVSIDDGNLVGSPSVNNTLIAVGTSIDESVVGSPVVAAALLKLTSIPGGFLVLHRGLRIEAWVYRAAGADVFAPIVTYGGSTIITFPTSADVLQHLEAVITADNGSTGDQRAYGERNSDISSGAASVDATVAQDLILNATKGTATDRIACDYWSVEALE